MKTEVYKKLPIRHDMTGQAVSMPVMLTDELISEGLARRLYNYAIKRNIEAGFISINSWEATVFTIDAESKPSERRYCVRFENDKGNNITLVGILLRNGWPSLDHNYEIDGRN